MIRSLRLTGSRRSTSHQASPSVTSASLTSRLRTRAPRLTACPYQAEELARLAVDFPNQTFIVNHCGSPIDRDHDGMLRWKEGLKRLGSAPNILIKISALTAYDPSPTPESLRDVALHCIECFGVDRSIFGSDFPVGRLWTSYDAIFDGFKAIVRDFSEAEQSALFHDSARRVYRMEGL
jgi:predicted TIM-barrel fold metal-dependent hydrolase